MPLVYHFASVFQFAIFKNGGPGFMAEMKAKQETYRASKQARIILGKNFISKNASTYTFGKTAALYGDICPKAIISIPFWRWIRTRASTCPVSPSTCDAAWLPCRPLAPTAIN